MDRGMGTGQDGDPSGAAPLRDASRRNEELADLLLEADEPKAREEAPIWTCAGCGNHDKARIKWHRSGGYFDPPEYDPECMECGSGDIEEGFAEVLGKVISQRDKLQEKVEELELKAGLPAPEAASAEGSPSELDALRTELEEEKTARMSAERALDDWLEVHKEFAAAWKASGPDPFAHPSGPSQDSQEVSAENIDWVEALVTSYNGFGLSLRDVIYKAIAYGRKEAALLSQSPKGTQKPLPIKDEDYPHSLDDCIRRMEFLAIEGIADGSRSRIGGLCLSVAEHLERLKLLESPKGAAGAGRECWVKWKDSAYFGEGDFGWYPFLAQGGTDKPIQEQTGTKWIRMVEAEGDRPSAPKTGLRGADAPGEVAQKEYRPLLSLEVIEKGDEAWVYNGKPVDGEWVPVTSAIGSEYKPWNGETGYHLFIRRPLPRPAPGDVGEAGGAAV